MVEKHTVGATASDNANARRDGSIKKFLSFLSPFIGGGQTWHISVTNSLICHLHRVAHAEAGGDVERGEGRGERVVEESLFCRRKEDRRGEESHVNPLKATGKTRRSSVHAGVSNRPQISYRGRGRWTHRRRLTKQSCIPPPSTSRDKAQMWVHRSEDPHTYTQRLEQQKVSHNNSPLITVKLG